MKKKYLIAGVITLVVFVAVFILYYTLPSIDVFNSISTSQFDVETSKDIILDFKDANVTLNEWGKDYVEVSYDNVFGGKKQLDITAKGNTIVLNSKPDFSGYKHLDVYIPKAVICVNAESIRAKSGTYRKITADRAEFRYCSMADSFESSGKDISFREGKFLGSCTIKNETINVRECDFNDVILLSDTRNKRIDAHFRQINGKSVRLDAKACSSLSAELVDPKLDNFIVEYDGENGSLTVVNGSIKNIQNNSKLKISNKMSKIFNF